MVWRVIYCLLDDRVVMLVIKIGGRGQVIEQDGKPAFYVVPAALWERMREAAEDAEDIADLERFEREDDGVRYPAAVAMAMAEGDAGELADALGHIAKARSVRLVAVPKGAVAQPRQR